MTTPWPMPEPRTYLDRDGTERIEPANPDHDPWCDGHGWLITGTEDHPKPCLDCRPHLRRKRT